MDRINPVLPAAAHPCWLGSVNCGLLLVPIRGLWVVSSAQVNPAPMADMRNR